MRNIALLTAAAVALTGCATNPKDITPNYVSPVLYQNLSCQQLAQEAQRVSNAAAAATGAQQQQVTKDGVATGVAIVLFWPALFFIGGDKQTAAQIAQLKGEMQAIEQANISKGCGITFAKG